MSTDLGLSGVALETSDGTLATSGLGGRLRVNIWLVRDDDGKALLSAVVIRERLTDDRGIYRIYGLPPGAYLIVAGGAQQFGGPPAYSAYANDSPIYFPSSARDTASEVVVRNGEEITADIQYRSEPGHSISGTVGGLVQLQTQTSFGATIGLIAVRDRSTIW